MAFFKADKMKQRLQSLSPRGLSCSSAASTSVVAIDRRHSPRLRDPHRSSTSMKLKNTVPPPQPQEPTSSPASSSRFLLNSSRLQPSDVTILDTLPPPNSFIEQDLFAPVINNPEQTAESSSSTQLDGIGKSKAAMVTRSCSTRSQHQVVVLKVSLHCKGCAGKVKKHISKMQGVTSFDIDIATKKVTVMGDVTPLGVLNCISKVKSAQFWPSSSSPASPPRTSASF